MSHVTLNRLKQFRKQKGWTQERLASIADVSLRTVQRIEGGKPASPDTAMALAAAFDMIDFHTLADDGGTSRKFITKGTGNMGKVAEYVALGGVFVFLIGLFSSIVLGVYDLIFVDPAPPSSVADYYQSLAPGMPAKTMLLGLFIFFIGMLVYTINKAGASVISQILPEKNGPRS